MDISGKERVGVAVIVVLAVAAAVTGICVRSCRKAPEPAPSDLVSRPIPSPSKKLMTISEREPANRSAQSPERRLIAKAGKD